MIFCATRVSNWRFFSAFVTEQWRCNSGSGTAAEVPTSATVGSRLSLHSQLIGTGSRSRSYYGSGECCLWQWDPDRNDVQVFEWTGRNDYYMLSEADFLALGGGYAGYSCDVCVSLILCGKLMIVD